LPFSFSRLRFSKVKKKSWKTASAGQFSENCFQSVSGLIASGGRDGFQHVEASQTKEGNAMMKPGIALSERSEFFFF